LALIKRKAFRLLYVLFTGRDRMTADQLHCLSGFRVLGEKACILAGRGCLLPDSTLTPTKNHKILEVGIIGSVLYGTTSKADALLFDAEFRETVPPPRTRVVQLKTPLPVGAVVTGNDLSPQPE
jgi:hypothetical protein